MLTMAHSEELEGQTQISVAFSKCRIQQMGKAVTGSRWEVWTLGKTFAAHVERGIVFGGSTWLKDLLLSSKDSNLELGEMSWKSWLELGM